MATKGYRRAALWLKGSMTSCIFFLLAVYFVCLEGCLNKMSDGDECVVDNHVIQEGENYIFPGCTISCFCINGELSCDNNYRCDSNEVCQQQRNGIYQCTCNPDGFEFVGGACVSICSENEVYGACACETSCANPQVCLPCAQDKRCYCPNGFYLQGQDCVKQEECSCFNEGYLISEGENYIFPGCTISCFCINGELSCDNYRCDSNEVCQQQRNGIYQCTCNPDGFEFVGGACVPICSEYEVYGTCACEISCAIPQICLPCAQDKQCYCPNGFYRQGKDCVIQEECSCFNEGYLISNGESYLNSDCTQLCSCVNDQLNCVPYQCSPNAACVLINGVWHCICNYGYTGDGLTCAKISTMFKDCYEAREAGNNDDGIYEVLPLGWPGSPFNVYCDMTGGGWTVFQRRTDGITDFYRGWDEYKNGFGSTYQDNDFWLGNEQLHYLTDQKDYKLRIDLLTSSHERLFAEYASFVIGDEDTKYQLDVEGFSGDARDGLSLSNGKPFSARDQDNDGCITHNYAESHKGGWWYTDNRCGYCSASGGDADFLCNFFEYTVGNCDETIGTYSNLNGDYNGGDGENIFWVYSYYRHCYLNSTVMRILPTSV